MSDFSFLQYVANPFALIAVVACVLGISFHVVIKKFRNPKQGFILAMYGMFTISILALGLGGLAMILMLQGATDEVSFQKKFNFALIPTTHAEKIQPKIKNINSTKKKTGWIWAGETETYFELKDDTKMQSQTLYIFEAPKLKRTVLTKKKANLRDAPPYFQWFLFRYKLGKLIETLPAGKKLRVLERKRAGFQLWLHVEVLEEDPIPKSKIPLEFKRLQKIDFQKNQIRTENPLSKNSFFQLDTPSFKKEK